jgi:hypothetical protein
MKLMTKTNRLGNAMRFGAALITTCLTLAATAASAETWERVHSDDYGSTWFDMDTYDTTETTFSVDIAFVDIDETFIIHAYFDLDCADKPIFVMVPFGFEDIENGGEFVLLEGDQLTMTLNIFDQVMRQTSIPEDDLHEMCRAVAEEHNS